MDLWRIKMMSKRPLCQLTSRHFYCLSVYGFDAATGGLQLKAFLIADIADRGTFGGLVSCSGNSGSNENSLVGFCPPLCFPDFHGESYGFVPVAVRGQISSEVTFSCPVVPVSRRPLWLGKTVNTQLLAMEMLRFAV